MHSELKAGVQRGTLAHLVSAREAAFRLGLSVWTVYAWARAGRLASVRLGRRRLFAEADLHALIDACRERAPQAASPEER
jgi:excisionase family DNA binding protein